MGFLKFSFNYIFQQSDIAFIKYHDFKYYI